MVNILSFRLYEDELYIVDVSVRYVVVGLYRSYARVHLEDRLLIGLIEYLVTIKIQLSIFEYYILVSSSYCLWEV
jgi:hypothetical protein